MTAQKKEETRHADMSFFVLVVEDSTVAITITACRKGGRVVVLQHDRIR